MKKAEAFIDSAELKKENNIIETKSKGKPSRSGELTKPVSISLSKTNQKALDDQSKSFNMLAYKIQLEDD